MAILGRGGRVLYQIVGIDDACDACGETGSLGVSFGPHLPVVCFECLRGGVRMAETWEKIPGGPPQFKASTIREIPRGTRVTIRRGARDHVLPAPQRSRADRAQARPRAAPALEIGQARDLLFDGLGG